MGISAGAEIEDADSQRGGKSGASAAGRRRPGRPGGPVWFRIQPLPGGKSQRCCFSSRVTSPRRSLAAEPGDEKQQCCCLPRLASAPPSSAAPPPLSHSLTFRKSTPSADLYFGHLKKQTKKPPKNRRQCSRGGLKPDGLNKQINLGISLSY